MSEDVAPRIESRTDEASFWASYDEAVPHVYGFLVRRADRSVAEDLTQEVFVTAARTYRDGGAAKVTLPWLLTVARSRLVDHYRAEGRRERNLRLAWSARGPEHAAGAEAVAADAAFTARTEAALQAVPALQRAALVLHHLDDLSVADVADQLGKSVRATESLLARARRSFRTAFEEVAP